MKKIVARFECASDKKKFERENIPLNISRATKLFYFVIVFEIVMLLRVFLTKSQPYPDYIMRYIICYASLLTVSVITLVSVLLTRRTWKNHIWFLEILTAIYEFGFLIWSVVITTLDSYSSERFIVYLTVVVSMVSILKIRPWMFFSIEIGGYFLLNAAFFLYLNRINASQLINLTIFTVIFVVISISNYNASVADFYNKKKIEQLNEGLEAEKERYKLAAKTDQLTGLFSRNILKADTEKRIAENYKTGRATGIAMFDLDDFKKINDTYGHSVGDECLKKLGECFRQFPFLTVYRYGGEEFLAVCDGISESEFKNTIEKILKSVAAFEVSADKQHITISAGWVYDVPENETCDEKMINAADSALYEAKKSGKNRCIKK